MHKAQKPLYFAASLMLFLFPACRLSSPEPIASATSSQTRYQCPMHPQFVSSDQAALCGICNMALVPLNSPSGAPGTVHLSADQARTIGVTISTVEERELSNIIRAAGRVVNDPYFISMVLEVQNTSQQTPGDANQQENQSRYNTSLVRMQQIGVDPKLIAKRLDSSLSHQKPDDVAWVHADVFDYEATLVRPEQKVDIESAAFPGRVFMGQVVAIDAALSKDTHTLRVRIGVKNSDRALKPEMIVTAALHTSLGKKLSIPSSAVLDTGVRKVVFVNTAEGVFEPREVRLGRSAGEYTEVLNGVQTGDKVVTSANFFLDSESKIRSF